MTDHPAEPGTSQTGIHPLLPKAVTLHQQGRIADASQLYQQILAEWPGQFDAAHMLGVIALQEGRFADAQNQIAEALRTSPNDTAALINLGVAYLRDEKLAEALPYARRAVQIAPDSVDALFNLGTVLHGLSMFYEAIAPLQEAYGINPRSSLISNMLGSCLLKNGDAPGAAEVFESATVASPSDPDSWANLSVALNAFGEHHRALQCAEKSVSLRSNSARGLTAQATSLFQLGKIDEAIGVYRQAVKYEPDIETRCSFANALISSGMNDEAVEQLQRALEMDPRNASARWIRALAELKPIYSSQAEIDTARVALARSLDVLRNWPQSVGANKAYLSAAIMQPFYLAYQEVNNTDLLRLYGDVCRNWMQTMPAVHVSAPPPAREEGKMRVGFASIHLCQHSVWTAITKGWVEHLDKNKFDVYLFGLNGTFDAESRRAKAQVKHFEEMSTDLIGWVKAIKEAHLDALIFPDVGMDSMSGQLSSLRLAPIQATTWGHPESTGIPTIDYYISSEAMEPEHPQVNYTEKLVQLPNTGVYVEELKPKIQDPRLKALGLPRDKPLLLCPGTPFKYSPTTDWVWAKIGKGLSERKEGGRLVFFAGTRGAMDVMLFDRLRKAFELERVDFDACVSVIPVLDRPRFFGLLEQSTLMLDTLGFSGYNTALQGLECGLPVLAYDGKFMRGRLASSLMRVMDMPELIATTKEDFVRRALALSADKKALKVIKSEIAKRRGVLFRDLKPVRALEQFLEKAIEEQRANSVAR